MLTIFSYLAACITLFHTISPIDEKGIVTIADNNTEELTFIRVWIPNCANAKEIVEAYRAAQTAYKGRVKFMLVGITNDAKLIEKQLTEHDKDDVFYTIDATIADKLDVRYPEFCKRVCTALHVPAKQWDTLVLKQRKVVFIGNMLDFSTKRINKFIQKAERMDK